MKILKESMQTADDMLTSTLQNLIKSEQTAIDDYEKALVGCDLSHDETEKINEILADEKDHIVVLSVMLQQHLADTYPGSGEN